MAKVDYNIRCKFIQFLIENDCLANFWENLDREQNNLNELFEKYKPKYILFHSFKFSRSIEGEEFWIGINNKWIEICKNIISAENKSKYLKRFFKFLKKQKCYDNYIRNVGKETDERVEKYLLDVDKCEFIGVFNWDFSEEGFGFWRKMNWLWLQTIYNEK